MENINFILSIVSPSQIKDRLSLIEVAIGQGNIEVAKFLVDYKSRDYILRIDAYGINLNSAIFHLKNSEEDENRFCNVLRELHQWNPKIEFRVYNPHDIIFRGNVKIIKCISKIYDFDWRLYIRVMMEQRKMEILNWALGKVEDKIQSNYDITTTALKINDLEIVKLCHQHGFSFAFIPLPPDLNPEIVAYLDEP